MASSHPGIRQPWSCGRGFASMDPERQREVIGYIPSGPITTAPAPRQSAARSTRLDWMRVQPEQRESANYEGSSSRRGR